jgi:hypothetical protein
MTPLCYKIGEFHWSFIIRVSTFASVKMKVEVLVLVVLIAYSVNGLGAPGAPEAPPPPDSEGHKYELGKRWTA